MSDFNGQWRCDEPSNGGGKETSPSSFARSQSLYSWLSSARCKTFQTAAVGSCHGRSDNLQGQPQDKARNNRLQRQQTHKQTPNRIKRAHGGSVQHERISRTTNQTEGKDVVPSTPSAARDGERNVHDVLGIQRRTGVPN